MRGISTVLYSLVFLALAQSLPMKDSISEVKITKRDTSAIDELVLAGHDIELTCKARGPTPPLIHWLFNGEHVEQSPLDQLSQNILAPVNPGDTESQEEERNHDYSSVSTLIIKNANSSKAGLYTCVADLVTERRTKSFNIQVTEPSVADDGSPALKRTVAAEEETRIYLFTKSVMEYEGVSTRLICRATQGSNKPPPTITWSIDNQVITNSTAGFQVENNGDLKILRTSSALHMADLKCTAVGNNGKSDVKEPFIYLFAPTK